MITHRDRLEACLSLAPTDRTPVSLWRHFPVDDQTPEGLARATIAFQRQFDFDLVKVTPASSFCLKDWGVEDVWRGSSEGTRDYTHYIIQNPEDWEHLPVLDPYKGHLGAQLQCLEIIVRELGPDTPVLQTIFSPLSQAKNLSGGANLLVHLRRYPEALKHGLQIITETTRRFIDAAHRTGIAGIFYAVQHAQFGLLSVEEYQTFGRPYDLQVLELSQDLWLNMLHLHGSEVMFDLFVDYPVQVFNWHDRESYPNLKEGLKRLANRQPVGVACGGIQRQTITLGDPSQVMSEAREAIAASQGRAFILGTGCVTPIIAPYGNILAARLSVEAGE